MRVDGPRINAQGLRRPETNTPVDKHDKPKGQAARDAARGAVEAARKDLDALVDARRGGDTSITVREVRAARNEVQQLRQDALELEQRKARRDVRTAREAVASGDGDPEALALALREAKAELRLNKLKIEENELRQLVSSGQVKREDVQAELAELNGKQDKVADRRDRIEGRIEALETQAAGGPGGGGSGPGTGAPPSTVSTDTTPPEAAGSAGLAVSLGAGAPAADTGSSSGTLDAEEFGLGDAINERGVGIATGGGFGGGF